ncbi:MAG: alpha-galactosidase [Clostridia bacterium]|nr:alpha-galactosidase [Clostridia bacterium]
MSITFSPDSRTFYLDGKGVTYAFCINEYGYAEHLYYGSAIGHDDLRAMRMLGATSYRTTPPGRDLNTSSSYGDINSYHHFPSELSFFGTGDFREPALMLTHENGDRLAELLYVGHEILPEKPRITGMPSLRGSETLVVHLGDAVNGFGCDLYYTVYDDCGVIARRAVYRNGTDHTVMLDRAYSFSFSLPRNDYELISLWGTWAKERHVERTPMHHGVFTVDSKRTTSSATLNPFIAVVDPDTTEQAGSAYGVSLIYSSSYALKVEGTSDGQTLVTGGINDLDFRWKLGAGEVFETPEVMLAYSAEGIGGMSRALHDAMRSHLIPPARVHQPRPIVINNWEATYFNFDNDKLKAIAQAVAGTGIDTFVLDDGWFGNRNSDRTGLGDWFVNTEKLEGGLSTIIAYVNSLGMKFGLWFEPEMVSEDSELFRAHPDYAIAAPDRARCYGRHQFMLDLTRAEVRDYIVDAVNKVLHENHIEYVKWDYNRNVTESYSIGRPADQQAEFAHRYALGVYDLCERIVNANPDIFFEGCASGGARFDPAMLAYFPQIWTSDDTDAEERTYIQYGTSMAYPLSAMSCHVSVVPNHQTRRVTPIETRADIAHLGATGYELDTSAFTDEDRARTAAQVEAYKAMEQLVLEGDLWRTEDPHTSNYFGFMIVSKDKTDALLTAYRRMGSVNNEVKHLRVAGLDADKTYRVSGFEGTFRGSTLMQIGLPAKLPKGDFLTATYRFTAVD